MHTIISALALSLFFFQSSGQLKKTDREYDELNGSVRSVRVETEDPRDQQDAVKTTPRFLEKIVAYDLSGRVTEEVHSFQNNCVSARHVFSYDNEGNRTEAIYSGKSLAAGDKTDPPQPPASPLIQRQVFKLDSAGRRSEIYEYDDKGARAGKSLYKYNAQGRINEITKDNISSKWRCEFKYNDKGLASEEACKYSDFRGSDRSQYTYEYDANGNWIKRTAKRSNFLPNGSVTESIRIHHREIKYYASKKDQAQQDAAGDRFDTTKLAPCPPMIVRKSGGALQGSVTRKVMPQYPPGAKAARIGGAVVVEVTVDETGKVIAARSISGPAELREAAVEAARGWVFTPTRLSGSPVKVIGTIMFNFNL